jgi:hypothetical protein
VRLVDLASSALRTRLEARPDHYAVAGVEELVDL